MPTRLIVNADDFGLTPGVNRAIAELHDAGAVGSATLMARGRAFEDAVRIARERPGLGVGCHVVLTDGSPAAAARQIPSLLVRQSEGRQRLRPSLLKFVGALLSGQIDEDEIEREAVAQIEHLQRAGLTVTHVDTHKHTHLFPAVLRPLLRAMERTGVYALRNPFEQPWAFRLSNGSMARTSQIRLLHPLQRSFQQQLALRKGEIRTTDGTVGVSATGSLDRATLQALVMAMPEGTWELVCHPGYNDPALGQIVTRLRGTREVERQALLEVLGGRVNGGDCEEDKDREPLQLIHYGDLVAAATPTQAQPVAAARSVS